MDSRHISVVIQAPWRQVYKFAANPHNLPLWASGLSSSPPVMKGDTWLVNSPQGVVELRFCAANDYGVLDHWVRLPNGAEIYIPLRVIAQGANAEVIFTLHRQPDMTDAQFQQDADWVLQDLQQLAKHFN